jgi:hypothetical protein
MKQKNQHHNVQKLELTYRLLFFLRDMGIDSAHIPAVLTWDQYVVVTTQIIANEMVESQ